MFDIIFVFTHLFILVTCNSIQGIQNYPLRGYQPNYVIYEQPATNVNNLDVCPQSYYQNTWPSYGSFPSTQAINPKDQLGYYDSSLLNTVLSALTDVNTPFTEKNDVDTLQYMYRPENTIPMTNWHYTAIPEQYSMNQILENDSKMFLTSRLSENKIENGWINNEYSPNIDYSYLIQKLIENNLESSGCNSKKYISKGISPQEDNDGTSSKYNKTKSKRKSKTSKNKRIRKNCKEHNSESDCISPPIKDNNFNLETNANVNDKIIKGPSKMNSKRKKIKSSKLNTTNRNKETKVEDSQLSKHNTLDRHIENCIDINENCVNLENRRTRNNYDDNSVQHFQHFPNMPTEFNIASYLNSFLPNQNLNTNLFTRNSNVPYNFDYLHQMAQQYNLQNSNGSNKKRKSKRNNAKAKRNKKSSKNKSDNRVEKECSQVVKLSPKCTEIEKNNKVSNIKEEAQANGLVENKFKEVPYNATKKNVKVITEPKSFIVDELKNQNSDELPVSGEYIPNIYDNDIFDDYYPDFRSDKIYLNEEDDDWNFHDRHLYISDKKAETIRERQKHENNKKHELRQLSTALASEEFVIASNANDRGSDDKQTITSVEEVKFKIPPRLDFPDFKTEIVNKDKHSSRIDNHKNNNEKISNVKYHNNKSETDLSDTVETVYGHSKVVKYGVTEPAENTTKKPIGTPRSKITKQDPTIVVAQSIKYPGIYT